MADDIIQEDVGLGVDPGRLVQWLEGGGAQDGMPRNTKRSVINLTMTDGGFSTVSREADLGALGFRPDLEVEGSVEEATVDGKPYFDL